MYKTLHKIILTVVLVCGAVTAAWADGWKLSGTTVYGAGGYWENGQKTRVDCSYRKGQFQYERKVSSGTKMSVYSTKAVFTEPEQRYAPGANIAINIAFTEKGSSQGYAPYARMTVMPEKPNWTKGKGASNKIPASGTVDGQATDASGRFTVTPSETTTLTAKAPSSGSQMAIVYSCNGMDVVYLYDWDGAVAAPDRTVEQETASSDAQPNKAETTMAEEVTTMGEEVAMEEEAIMEEETLTEEETPMEVETAQEEEVNVEEEPVAVEENDIETPDEEENANGEDRMNYGDDYSNMVVKFIVVGVVALVLIVLIILVFRKKDRQSNEEKAEQQQVCPKCGTPMVEGDVFCQNCGHQLN